MHRIYIGIVLCVLFYCEALKETDRGVCKKSITKTRNVPKTFYTSRQCRKRPPCTRLIRETYKVTKLTCCIPDWQYVKTANSTDFCQPICLPSCENGTCIGPNDCRCEFPLRLRNGVCVQPVCAPACGSFSTCTDTDTCTCDKGFIAINSTHCAPQCATGYYNDPIECKPRCIKCVNGTCSAPNVCTCNDGYTKIDNHTCSPTCDPSCDNAVCVDLNVCSCLEGFYKINKWKCSPVCVNCTHGDCVAPGNCKCHEDYEKRDGVCKPVCERPCKSGTCVEPNKCQCNVGHDLDPNDKFNCLPICEPKCVNASCVSPNTCSCLEGYETTGNNWTCKPRCDECDNGDCIEPNNCRCHPGYEKVNGRCKPKCSKACQNGICSEPEVCTCVKNYTLRLEDKYSCDPICEPKCVNSTCVAPGVCKCLPKYQLTKAKHVCKPHCKLCVNGDCVAPEECRCHRGYNMTRGTCTPVCSAACVNSRCTLPDTCTCMEGYTRNLTTPSVCYKECAGPCDHGACDLHGNCTCNPGYELENDTCVSNPVDCSSCISHCTEDVCVCASGQPCYLQAKVASSTNLAGLELTWMMGAAVGSLLIVLLLVVLVRIGSKRHQHGNKSLDDKPNGSVVFTVADTLINRRIPDNYDSQERFYEELDLDGRLQEEKENNDHLLRGARDERL